MRPNLLSGRAIGQNGEATIRWVRKTELAELPLSTTGRKIANLLGDESTTDISDSHGQYGSLIRICEIRANPWSV